MAAGLLLQLPALPALLLVLLLPPCAAPAAAAAPQQPQPPAQPAGWTTQRNRYPLTYGAHGPAKLPGKFSNSSLAPCFATCTAAHQSHTSCLGFTSCSAGPVGCWLYSDIGTGALGPSPDCDWHAAPWGPQVLCWAPEFGVCRIGFPPPEKNEPVLSFKKWGVQISTVVPFQSKPNTPF